MKRIKGKHADLASKTLTQYNEAFKHCREIFHKKIRDYGTSWRILRPHSLTDQLFIKARRIRTLELKALDGGIQMIEDGIEEEFSAIVNYVIITLIQIELGFDDNNQLNTEDVLSMYDRHENEIRKLMLAKNHDYGEAWRQMRISSFTDMILAKLMRVRQIEDNDGVTIISEGLESHYCDMANYALFALIKLAENHEV